MSDEQDRRKMAPGSQQAAPRSETIDSEIDRAVRELMSVDADPSFRARVLARLEPRRRLFSWTRLGVATAACAALVLAVVLTRTSVPGPVNSAVGPSTPGAPSTTPAPISELTQAGQTAGQSGDALAASGRRQPGSARASVARAPRVRPIVAAVAEVRPGVEITPLEQIEQIRVVPLEQTPIAQAEIVIAPLAAIEALQIAPLSPQSQRD